MNKNFVLAFSIIMLSIIFFNSKFYYEKILKKPHPSTVKRELVEKKAAEQKKELEEQAAQKEIVEKETVVEKKEVVQESNLVDTVGLSSLQVDTIPLDTIWVESDKLICGISERGGRIISLKTKEYSYKTKKGEEERGFIELIDFSDKGGANLTINSTNYDSKTFRFSGEQKKVTINDDQEVAVEFEYKESGKEPIIKKFVFKNDSYTIEYSIISTEIIDKKVITGWHGGIAESEKIEGRSAQFNKKKIHFYGGGNSEHLEGSKEERLERSGGYDWAAISSKYFAVALIPEEKGDGNIAVQCYFTKDEMTKKKNERELSLSVDFDRFCDKNQEDYTIYAGPTRIDDLKSLDVQLEKVLFGVSTGIGKFFATIFIGGRTWFPKICEFVLWLLIVLQKMVVDYGVVIIILTILLRIVTYPLTQSSMKSMNKMKEIQPKIAKIREKYKGNVQKMNQKIMEFYKTEGISPLGGMGGCLPMILQMPIMVSLFVVLRKAIELRGQGTFLIPWIKDLSEAEVLFPLGFNVPLYGSNFALLPVLMGVLMYFQNKSTIKDPNQKAMIYMMPVMMLVMFNNFPSGLCLYFTFSTALQLVQQKVLDRKKESQKK